MDTHVTRTERKRTQFRPWLALLLRIAALTVIGYLLLTQVFMFARVHGQDMFPALKDGDLAIGFRLDKSDLTKGSVIAYRDGDTRRFGRVAARENDVVEITQDGTLVVNGTLQSEEILYPTQAGELLTYPYRVPEESVFVLGDFRTNTHDSRDLGAIPIRNIESRIITILRRRGL